MVQLDDLVTEFEGTYTHKENNRPFSQETFKVMRDTLTLSYKFESEILTRVANGQFLKITTNYFLNKDNLPFYVEVHKLLGNQIVIEIYNVNFKAQTLNYSFSTQEETKDVEISLPPKFHISTPAMVTSFLFYLAKKYDSNGVNFYNIIKSNNVWEYENEPSLERVNIENPNNGYIDIKLNNAKKTCTQFNVTTDNGDSLQQGRPVIYYVSKHMAIPYRMIGPKQVKVEIDFFKHHERDDMKLI